MYKEPKGEEFKIYMAWGSSDLEDKLIELQLRNATIYLILKEGKAIPKCPVSESIKQNIACPHCGGVDTHRYDCKGGYGL